MISPPGTHGEHLRGGLIASGCDNLRVLSRSFDRNNNFLEKFFGKDILIVSLEKYILFFAIWKKGVEQYMRLEIISQRKFGDYSPVKPPDRAAV